MNYPKSYLSLLLIFVLMGTPYFMEAQSKKQLRINEKAEKLLQEHAFFTEFNHLASFKIDSLWVNRQNKILEIYLNKEVSYIPLRENMIAEESLSIKEKLGWKFREYKVVLFSGNKSLRSLVPNYYRSGIRIDSSHFPKVFSQKSLYTRLFDRDYPGGMSGKHIALWHSHGKYYESKLDRWEWQRARLHTSVEDLLPMSFVLPYLSKMLENAGAITFIPRERDIQETEVIVDDHLSHGASRLILNEVKFSFEAIKNQGFKYADLYTANQNPFRMGDYLLARAENFLPGDSAPEEVAVYLPDIPKRGEYAVYISYGPNPDALSPILYEVRSGNGTHPFLVDQTMGAGTWIYLGHFYFEEGMDPENGQIIVYSLDPASPITLDAIKIGGGKGSIGRRPGARAVANKWSLKNKEEKEQNKEFESINHPTEHRWKLSGSPRYHEAARYYLQYAGMPDSLVYNLNDDKNDYNDDYQCRGEWVNYLKATPMDSEEGQNHSGLGIPIDLSFAFHTDAGVTQNDSIIGTLGIYSSEEKSEIFPNGQSRNVNRELTDIIQSNIVDDIQQIMHPAWTRRGIWNKAYSEAYRADVPSMLLELLSHQNLADMVFGLDPRFRFHVSRSIYKGMLEFLSFQQNKDVVVQPLPVDHFAIHWENDKQITLRWQAVEDPLEESATPEYYEVYMSENNGGFKRLADKLDSLSLVIDLPSYDTIYRFKIVAVNKGGRSFPSEILSVGIGSKASRMALVVNAFDRISGPAIVDEGDFAGIAYWEDQGVADKQEIGFVGQVYDYDRRSPWLDDDSPGWGASDADWEGRVIPGNTFDFPFIHGQSILANGLSFTSMSDEVFEKESHIIKDYDLLDIIFGEEKTSKHFKSGRNDFVVFTPDMMNSISETLGREIPVFLSGAYIGSDFIENKDSLAIQFAKKSLHYIWRSNHADKGGWVKGTDSQGGQWAGNWTYNAGYHPHHYRVEAPDAIEVADKWAACILRYKKSGSSAGIAFQKGMSKGVVLGFPFESILSEKARNEMMANILRYFFE